MIGFLSVALPYFEINTTEIHYSHCTYCGWVVCWGSQVSLGGTSCAYAHTQNIKPQIKWPASVIKSWVQSQGQNLTLLLSACPPYTPSWYTETPLLATWFVGLSSKTYRGLCSNFKSAPAKHYAKRPGWEPFWALAPMWWQDCTPQSWQARMVRRRCHNSAWGPRLLGILSLLCGHSITDDGEPEAVYSVLNFSEWKGEKIFKMTKKTKNCQLVLGVPWWGSLGSPLVWKREMEILVVISSFILRT